MGQAAGPQNSQMELPHADWAQVTFQGEGREEENKHFRFIYPQPVMCLHHEAHKYLQVSKFHSEVQNAWN